MKGEDGNIIREVELTGPASKQYLVQVRTGHGEYEGIFHSPFPDKRLAEALYRMETFVNLKDAKDLTTEKRYPFMVISKDHIETIKVLDER